MANNKHDAVWEWLQSCPHIRDLFFDAADSHYEGTRLIPSESEIIQYLDGSKLMYYNCALTRYSAYSLEPNDTMNLENLVDFDLLSEWMEEQMALANLPMFPGKQSVLAVEVLPNESGFMVTQDLNQCKYMLQFRIEYLKG